MKELMPFRIFNKAPSVPQVEDQHWYKISAAAEGQDAAKADATDRKSVV